MPTLFITENAMTSKENKRKYSDDHREKEEASEEPTATSKK
jgi:hypothetical protein